MFDADPNRRRSAVILAADFGSGGLEVRGWLTVTRTGAGRPGLPPQIDLPSIVLPSRAERVLGEVASAARRRGPCFLLADFGSGGLEERGWWTLTRTGAGRL